MEGERAHAETDVMRADGESEAVEGCREDSGRRRERRRGKRERGEGTGSHQAGRQLGLGCVTPRETLLPAD
jgi:hypothetical protein